jgi:hypothetical protein
VLVGLVGVSLFVAGQAHAEPTAGDKETARRLMAEGRTHRRAGDAKGALQSFLAADAIMQVPTTGLEVAKAELELGQLVEARDKLLTVTRLPVEGREPRAFSEARATAKTLGAEVEPRIPSLTVKLQNLPAGSSPKVTVDGVAIPAGALTAPRAVDPGHHVVAASAGGDPHETAVDVREGETKDVVVDLGAGGAPVATDEPASGPAPTNASKDQANTWRLVSYAGFGVGGAGLIMGSVTGLLAISDFSSAKKQGCVSGKCPPAADPELNKASTMATVSTVGFILAGVGAGVGIAGFVLSRQSPHPEPTPAAPPETVGLFLGPGSVTLGGSF